VVRRDDAESDFVELDRPFRVLGAVDPHACSAPTCLEESARTPGRARHTRYKIIGISTSSSSSPSSGGVRNTESMIPGPGGGGSFVTSAIASGSLHASQPFTRPSLVGEHTHSIVARAAARLAFIGSASIIAFLICAGPTMIRSTSAPNCSSIQSHTSCKPSQWPNDHSQRTLLTCSVIGPHSSNRSHRVLRHSRAWDVSVACDPAGIYLAPAGS
jgi:hypothetical protein